jgi:hypothetical protein
VIRRRVLSCAVLGLLLAVAGSQAAPPLRVKVNPVAAPCLVAARQAYERASGRSFTIEAGDLEHAHSADGFDAVVGIEGELTRLLESGAVELDLGIARIPWVLVGGGGDVSALDRPRGRVLVLGGQVGLAARRRLQHLPAEQVTSLPPRSAAVRPGPDALAVVPLSLAIGAASTQLDIPPLEVRGLTVARSGDPEGARRLVEFLASPEGAAAFADCGAGR